jgi:predicted RND superfamily exporter protein
VGFAVLMVIDIPVIRDLALTASIGVAVLIFTNLLLLPVLLSYTGVSASRGRAQPARGTRGEPRQGPRRGVAVPRPLHDARWAMAPIAFAALCDRAASP